MRTSNKFPLQYMLQCSQVATHNKEKQNYIKSIKSPKTEKKNIS